jgi:6-pyruvoyltetrahydropterin/6-carboxytetrahydropterin synthase
MVVNIKRVEEMLRDRVIERLDGRSLNDEIAEFKLSPPSTENLVLWIWRELEPCCNALAGHPTLTSVRLAESDLLYGELVRYGTESEPNMTITRIYEFAAAHRLHVEALSGEENRDLFGKCNNPAGHGHNYVLEVTVTGDPDPRTGMLVDIEALDDAVQELVLDRYDHRNLNCDVPELQGLVPTSEVVATCIYEQLSGKLPAKLSRIRLHETARSIFEVS